MTQHDLALIGFGGVNRALAELIHTRGDDLSRELGFSIRIVAITDLNLGSLMRADGIDIDAVLALDPATTSFAEFAGGSSEPRNEWVIRNSSADVVVEATFTNPNDGEPAISHVRWALESGKSVCTTNKGPVALFGPELKALAEANHVAFEFEGSVMSGTPLIRFAHKMLSGLKVKGFEGILNGTSNYVLGRMESGLDFDRAIEEAKTLGYAEANPAADVEGSDVQLKVAILANEVLGGDLHPSEIAREGISALTKKDINDALARGMHWKLIGSAKTDQGKINARVALVALPASHPLAGISGPTNAVTFDTDLLGPITVSGPGAGRIETAYALLSDIVAIDSRDRVASRLEFAGGSVDQ